MLDESVQLHVELNHIGATTDSERRAEVLLAAVEESVFGNTKQRIRIGDADVFQQTVLNGHLTSKKEKACVLAFCYMDNIILQRRFCDVHMLAGLPINGPMTDADRAFIARNMNEIAHEIAHVITNTADGDPRHYEAQLQVRDKILCAMFPKITDQINVSITITGQ